MGFTITVQAYGKTSARQVIYKQVGIKSDADLVCIKATKINNQ